MTASPVAGSRRRFPLAPAFRFAIIAFTLAGLALRLFQLTHSDLWGDEAYSVWLSQRDPLSILADLAQGEPHPPFYPLLLWLWMKAAGSSEFAVRLPSVLLGTALVPLAALWGRRLAGRGAGLAAAALAVVNPFLLWYSQEARMYIAAATFATWSMLALDDALSGRRSYRPYVVATALLIYAHYYGLFVWAAQLIVLDTLAALDRARPRAWLRPIGLVGLLYLPWVAFSGRIFFSYYGIAPGRVDLPGTLWSFWQHAAVGMTLTGRRADALVLVYTALAVLGAAALAWRSRRTSGGRVTRPLRGAAQAARPLPLPSAALSTRFALLVAWLLVPLLGGIVVSLFRPMYAERYLIVSAPALLLLVAAGATGFSWRWAGESARRALRALGALAVLALVAGAGLSLQPYYFDAKYLKSQYGDHARQVAALALPGDAVLLDGHSQVFLQRYYYHGDLTEYLMPVGVPIDEAGTAAKLREIAARHRGAWLYLYATSDYDPGGFVERWLENNAYRAWHTWTINGRLLYFAFYPPERLTPLGGGFDYGASLRLEEISWPDGRPRTGEVVPLHLRWQGDETRPLKLSARLLDSEGYLWGSTDQDALRGPKVADGRIEDRIGLLIQPGTPPGDYRLELRLYQAADGKSLAPRPEGGQSDPGKGPRAEGEALVLGGVRLDTPAIGQGLPLPGLRAADQRLGPLTLVSYGLPGEAVAGQKSYLTFVWRAREQPEEDYRLAVELLDAGGSVAFRREVALTNGTYPTTDWPAGALLRGQYNLAMDPRLPGGTYRWRLSLLSANGEPSGRAELDQVQVKARAPALPSAQPQRPADAQFGSRARLTGYTVSPEQASAGGQVAVTLFWEPMEATEESYSVFVHVVDHAGQPVAQRDSVPCDGKCPTTSWVPGDTIEDRYEVSIPPGLPTGEYNVAVGLYLPTTGQRLASRGSETGAFALPGSLVVGQ